VSQSHSAAGAVFAGVFDVYGKTAEIFEKDFGGKPAVAAGARCGDQNLAWGIGPTGEAGGDFGV
jgi:hypothetical protein